MFECQKSEMLNKGKIFLNEILWILVPCQTFVFLTDFFVRKWTFWERLRSPVLTPPLIPHFIQRVLVVLRFMKCHPNTFLYLYIKKCCSFYKFFTIPFLYLPLKNWIVKRSDIHLSFILNGIPKVNRRQPEKKCTRKKKAKQ